MAVSVYGEVGGGVTRKQKKADVIGEVSLSGNMGCLSLTSVHGYSFGVSFELGYFKKNLTIILKGRSFVSAAT